MPPTNNDSGSGYGGDEALVRFPSGSSDSKDASVLGSSSAISFGPSQNGALNAIPFTNNSTPEASDIKMGSIALATTINGPSAASDKEIVNGTMSFAIPSITSSVYLRAMFAHPSFAALLAKCKAELLGVIDSKHVIQPHRTRVLRRACEYIISASKQPWFDHEDYVIQNAMELWAWVDDMEKFRITVLNTLPGDVNSAEGKDLGREVKRAVNAINGVQEAPPRERKVKEMRKSVLRLTS